MPPGATTPTTAFTNLIDGRLVPAASGRTLDVIEPATGAVYATAPASDSTDIDAAVLAAERAFPAWSSTSAAERAKLLERLADLIDANVSELAKAESDDTGKPITLARTLDIPRSAANLRFFAEAIRHTSSTVYMTQKSAVPGSRAATNTVLRSPRGVAGLISPWNLPLYLLTWKIAPAIATGNTCVCKPSEVTPATASMLGELIVKAGFPAGVINIVHGLGSAAGGSLVTHPNVPAISFTGSTAVGKWIGEKAGGMLKRISLELGGKNPLIVCEDADIDFAAELAERAGFTNQGQICLCCSRVLVHRSIYAKFVDRFVRRVGGRVIGDPRDERTQHGALVSGEHLRKVASAVDRARSLNGRVLLGGSIVNPASLPDRCNGGFFYAPTIIEGLDPACAVEQEEIFGPVVTLQPFDNDPHALKLANSTNYGLSASVVTPSLDRSRLFATKLNCGIVWINGWLVRDLRTPFGGTKHSGVGREGGQDALNFFTESTTVCEVHSERSER
jgi:aminomuconate-semialdehyde/2-hydroxymuconate-6-semialdehyde dehydrogenase